MLLRVTSYVMITWLIFNSIFAFSIDNQENLSFNSQKQYSFIHHSILKQYHSPSKISTNYLDEEEVDDESSAEYSFKGIHLVNFQLNFDLDNYKVLNKSLFFTVTHAINRPFFLLFSCWKDYMLFI